MGQSESIKASSEQKSFWSLALASLGYRDFRLIWTGSVVEHAGEFMEVAAILWLTNELTHSPLWLTIVGSCRFITMIFFPIIGGVVADRVNRRGLLMAALIGSALLSGLLALLAATKAINLTHLIIVSLQERTPAQCRVHGHPVGTYVSRDRCPDKRILHRHGGGVAHFPHQGARLPSSHFPSPLRSGPGDPFRHPG